MIAVNWIFLGVVLIAILVAILVFRAAVLRRRHLFTPAEISSLALRFADLEKKLHWDPRFVLLELDKLLDLLLRKKGYRGTTGEKLKAYVRGKRRTDTSAAATRGAQELWQMHVLRNRVAHEIDGEVSVSEARRAWRACVSAYRDAGIRLSVNS